MRTCIPLLLCSLAIWSPASEPWFTEQEIDRLAQLVYFDGVGSGPLVRDFQIDVSRRTALEGSVPPSAEAMRTLLGMWDSAVRFDIMSLQGEVVRRLPEDPAKVAGYSPEFLIEILRQPTRIWGQIESLDALGANRDGFGGLYNKSYVMVGATEEQKRKIDLSMTKERQQVSLTNLVGSYRRHHENMVKKMRRLMWVVKIHHSTHFQKVLSVMKVDEAGLKKLLADLD
jgi:hypothetical protein